MFRRDPCFSEEGLAECLEVFRRPETRAGPRLDTGAGAERKHGEGAFKDEEAVTGEL